MNILREYISGLLIEQDEEESTIEQKLKELFFAPGSSAHYAVELGKSYGDVDPEFMKLMEDVLAAAHDIIYGYLYYTEAFQDGDAKYEADSGWTIKGDGHEQRRYHANEEKIAFREALDVLGKHGEKVSIPNRGAIVSVTKIFTKLYDGEVWPQNIKGDPKEEQSYKDAITWAGKPS
jgi:hypothetical protein